MKWLLFKPWALKYLLRLWPPMLATGVRVDYISPDFRVIEASMRLRFYNRNFVGTQFGGGMSVMTDPFYMLMLYHVMGKDYYVWDKAGHIEFIKPGRSTLRARFELTDEILDHIRRMTEDGEKHFQQLDVRIVDESGELIAKVVRTVYVRKKPHLRALTQRREGAE